MSKYWRLYKAYSYNRRPRIKSKNYPALFRSIQNNGGKVLHEKYSRGRYLHQRNRKAHRCYYITQIKGNWIKSYRIEYLLDGKTVDTFMAFTVGALVNPDKAVSEAEQTKVVKILIVKTPIKNEDEHFRLFKEATPDLEWFEDVCL